MLTYSYLRRLGISFGIKVVSYFLIKKSHTMVIDGVGGGGLGQYEPGAYKPMNTPLVLNSI